MSTGARDGGGRTAIPLQSSIRLDECDAGLRVGLLVLFTDHTTEREFRHRLPSPAVSVYVNRVPYANPATPDSLRALAPHLGQAAAAILPGERLDALAFASTATSALLGDSTVRAALDAAKPGVPCVTPCSAAFSAFRALGVNRVAVLTPYSVEVSELLAGYLVSHGVHVSALRCLGFTDDRQIARIRPDSIIEAAIRSMDNTAEALFISCTALRAVDTVAVLEHRLGRPVVTSNQVMLWRVMRHLAFTAPIPGLGRLGNLPAA